MHIKMIKIVVHTIKFYFQVFNQHNPRIKLNKNLLLFYCHFIITCFWTSILWFNNIIAVIISNVLKNNTIEQTIIEITTYSCIHIAELDLCVVTMAIRSNKLDQYFFGFGYVLFLYILIRSLCSLFICLSMWAYVYPNIFLYYVII